MITLNQQEMFLTGVLCVQHIRTDRAIMPIQSSWFSRFSPVVALDITKRFMILKEEQFRTDKAIRAVVILDLREIILTKPLYGEPVAILEQNKNLPRINKISLV